MKSDPIRIAFIGLYNEENLGDPIITYCTEWLYRKVMTHHEITSSYLYLDYIEKIWNKKLLFRVVNKFKQVFLGYGKTQKTVANKLLLRTQTYFEQGIQGADLVVVVGGGLVKYSYQFFYIELTALLRAGEKLDVPIILNAVGIEGYDANDARCQLLKKMFQMPSLIYISTRDDLETLIHGYFNNNPSIPVEKVADPAVWAKEAFGIECKTDRNIIGVGVAREGIFQDNGIDFSPVQLKELYFSIIQKLLEQGCQVEIFTNGLSGDNILAKELWNELRKVNLTVVLRLPLNPRHLVEFISCYKGIIATRLHACIIAYSVNVPAVGLVWNNKLTLFGKNINREENFVTIANLNAHYIVCQLNKAIQEGYDIKIRSTFRQTILDSIHNVAQLKL